MIGYVPLLMIAHDDSNEIDDYNHKYPCVQGFFVPYLVGGISLGVLAVGSVAPGLLQFAIDKFGQLQPDYRERVLRHEAAHFLVWFLVHCMWTLLLHTIQCCPPR